MILWLNMVQNRAIDWFTIINQKKFTLLIPVWTKRDFKITLLQTFRKPIVKS